MGKDYSIFNNIKIDTKEYGEVFLNEEDKNKIINRLSKKIDNRNNRSLKEKTKTKKNRAPLTAAALVIALCGGILLTNESVLASIQSVGKQIESFFNKKEGTFEKYKKAALQEVSDKGITLKLREVMLGDEELMASLSIDSSKINREELGIKYKGDLNIIPSELTTINIDGKELKKTSAGGSYIYNKDGTVDALATFGIQNIDLNKTYKMNIICTKMLLQIPDKEHTYIDGNWALSFELDGKALAKDMRVLSINKKQTIKYDNQEFEVFVKELRISPLSWRLKYSMDMSKNVIDGKHNFNLKILDENNSQIKFFSGGGSSERGFIYEFTPKEKDTLPKKIKIIPQIIEDKIFKDKTTEFKDNIIEVDLNQINN